MTSANAQSFSTSVELSIDAIEWETTISGNIPKKQEEKIVNPKTGSDNTSKSISIISQRNFEFYNETRKNLMHQKGTNPLF